MSHNKALRVYINGKVNIFINMREDVAQRPVTKKVVTLN